MAILRLELIGGCELRTPSGQPLKLTARKARALLAFLALQDGAPQSRERLAALLWEDADTELARTSLRQALSAIRRALPESGRSALHADALQIALDPDELDVDVVRLRRLLADATSASLAIALDLYRGELLEGLDARSGAFDEWLGTERRSLRREVVVAAQKLRELCREAGDTTGEVAALTRVIALEPLNEPAYRELMEAYARSGRYTDALRQYQICRTALRRELDVAPEPATEALYRELMRRRRAASENDTLAPPQGEESSGPRQTAAPEPTPEPAAVANRALREAVVLLVNIHDLTAQQSELDPEDASELVGRIHSRADAVVREYGG
ncbi:MAG TPA: BTAD domain-containing putative transcriptional regulator, partial [Gammaproteobacteria bacterium]|nr:BTAD domain-containing putative transcriptional regulator [Gammaproteobacteria bacterium]